MIRQIGRARHIRQTDDGRYAVLYTRQPGKTGTEPCVIICNYLHIAIGYPAIRLLPGLRRYRNQHYDRHRAVNAYEQHEALYQQLAQQGGVVLVRGRGIVASRIIQRLYEVRLQCGQDARIHHLLRSALPAGNSYDGARREVANHWEYQPFNWPKAAWGGDLRNRLASASAEESVCSSPCRSPFFWRRPYRSCL